MKIYTKTGDKGLTSLIGGTRVSKHHLRIESYGTVDELNACIGLILAQNPSPGAAKVLLRIQDRLFVMGALLAADPELRLNGPTWGWLGAALRAIALTRSPGYAEAIQTPSLFFGAGRDRVCDTEAVRAFAGRVPDATYVEIRDAEHELLMERDIFRAQLWASVDAFLKKSAPAVSR